MWLCVQLYISIWNNTSNNKIKYFDNCVFCYFSLKIQTYCQNKNLTYKKTHHLSPEHVKNKPLKRQHVSVLSHRLFGWKICVSMQDYGRAEEKEKLEKKIKKGEDIHT